MPKPSNRNHASQHDWPRRLSEKTIDELMPLEPTDQNRFSRLPALRPYLELQLVIRLVRDPAAANLLTPGDIADPRVAELVALLREFETIAQWVRPVSLAKYLRCDSDFIGFVQWLTIAPPSFVDSLPSVASLVDSILFVDRRVGASSNSPSVEPWPVQKAS
jgi:hypothetical protein